MHPTRKSNPGRRCGLVDSLAAPAEVGGSGGAIWQGPVRIARTLAAPTTSQEQSRQAPTQGKELTPAPSGSAEALPVASPSSHSPAQTACGSLTAGVLSLAPEAENDSACAHGTGGLV